MKLIHAAALCGLAAVAAISSALADPISDERKDAVEPLSSSDGRSAGPTFLNAVAIEASTSDTKANISFAGFLPAAPIGDYFLYQLQGEAPVSKGSTDDVAIGTLSGLTAGASASTSVTAMWWPHQSPDMTGALRATCDAEFPNLIPGYQWNEGAQLGADNISCDKSLFTAPKLKQFIDAATAMAKKCTEKPPTLPADVAMCKRLKEQPPKLSRRAENEGYLRNVVEKIDAVEARATPATLLTLGAKVNRKKANYFAEPDYTKLKDHHTTGYGGNLTLSHVRNSWMVLGGYALEKNYQAKPDVEVCTPIEDSTSTKCITGPIGEPTHSFTRMLFVEGRVLIIAQRLAVAPRAEYDFEKSNYAVRLPIYIAPNKSKLLTGGIALGYTDKDDEGFGISVFVGKAFSFF